MSDDKLNDLPETPKTPSVNVPKPPQDEPLQGEIDDGYNNALARMTNALSVEAWRKIQIIVGAILGLASGACLFLIKSDPNSFIPLSFLFALFLALAVPNIAEKQLQRKVDIGRTALLIALAAVIVGYVIYGLSTGMFTATA